MKIFLLIQGHTKYCDFLIDQTANYDNVIWSTDETAPSDHLNKIKNSNIILETIPPISSGFGNINRQVATVMKGLRRVKELGGTHCIKIRSDMYFSDLPKFINNMVDDGRIHQLAYVNHVESSPSEIPTINRWIEYYNFDIKDLANYNYVLDFINYGPVDEMCLFWDYPFEQIPLGVPAEMKFVYRYLMLKNLELNMSFEYLSKIFGFFLTQLKELKIDLFTLKHEYSYTTLGTQNSCIQFFG
jgi:hypothetical protein